VDTLAELQIDEASLDWQLVPAREAAAAGAEGDEDGALPPARLTIAQAKIALARTFGVSPDNIEITIRG